MRLGLSMRVVSAVGYEERRDALSQDWIRWLAARGHTPVLIPNTLEQPAAYLEAMALDGLILTGGNDLVPRRDAPDDVAPERTRTEIALLEAALTVELPVFGTCRGLQVINLRFGGDQVADLCVGTHPTVSHVGCQHPVKLEPPFDQIAGKSEIQTNSFHNQGITDRGLAPELCAFAHASDGVVEGLVHPTRPVLAVQWHPERANPAADFDSEVFGRLLREGPFWREDDRCKR
jgi:putative glutamine amidotransferase